MGISHDSMHKRRATGGKKKAWRKKIRKYESEDNLQTQSCRAIRLLGGLGLVNKTTAALAKKEGEEGEAAAAASPAEEAKKSNHLQRKTEKHQKDHKLDAHIEEQFGGGCLLSCISSRPGQCGHADGYILEGKELEFYMKKIHRKKGKGAAA
ncbi:hypothetical protein LWI29_008362 [Acer saccharum]|uniref:40S ribosomal protein S8 n=1 Tax=Acer saccharum TaxID=4024 RepID=A0AA39T8K3_ACESA|nr:hypothetical protein LWI29_008362 [Acer saccharum]